jgi:hypothetical protein
MLDLALAVLTLAPTIRVPRSVVPDLAIPASGQSEPAALNLVAAL